MKVLLIIFVFLALSWANEGLAEFIEDLENTGEDLENTGEDLENTGEDLGNSDDYFEEEIDDFESIEDFEKASDDPTNEYLENVTEESIKQVIEDIRKIFKEKGLPDLGINSLDPLEIEKQRFLIDTFFKFDLNVTSQETVGLLDFELPDLKLKLNGLYFSFTINWPLITTHNDYGLFVSVVGQEIFGNGHIDVSASNFAVSGVGAVTISDAGLVKLKDLYLSLSLGDFDFKITGVMNDEYVSEVFSETITNSAQHSLKKMEKQLNDGMHEFIEFINELIAEAHVQEKEYINIVSDNGLNWLKNMIN